VHVAPTCVGSDHFGSYVRSSIIYFHFLQEDEEFDQRQLAALVVSKVLHHIFYISVKKSCFYKFLMIVVYHIGILLPW
jgi:hypothetical protein